MICISVYTQPHLVRREEREYTQYKKQVHCYTSLHSETHALILIASSSWQSCDLHLANHFSESLELLLDGELGSVPCELVQVIGWGDCNQDTEGSLHQHTCHPGQPTLSSELQILLRAASFKTDASCAADSVLLLCSVAVFCSSSVLVKYVQ